MSKYIYKFTQVTMGDRIWPWIWDCRGSDW